MKKKKKKNEKARQELKGKKIITKYNERVLQFEVGITK